MEQFSASTSGCVYENEERKFYSTLNHRLEAEYNFGTANAGYVGEFTAAGIGSVPALSDDLPVCNLELILTLFDS